MMDGDHHADEQEDWDLTMTTTTTTTDSNDSTTSTMTTGENVFEDSTTTMVAAADAAEEEARQLHLDYGVIEEVDNDKNMVAVSDDTAQQHDHHHHDKTTHTNHSKTNNSSSRPTATTHGQQQRASSWNKEEEDEKQEEEESLIRNNDHRYSASDWLQNMRSIPRSSILRSIRFPVLAVTMWSYMISIIHRYFVLQSMKTDRYDTILRIMCIDGKPHSFLMSALGLLLVFRTNSAYQRFNEGRQIWERILSVSRNLTRMILLHSDVISPIKQRRMLRLLASFPYLLHQHVQPTSNNNNNWKTTTTDTTTTTTIMNNNSSNATTTSSGIDLSIAPWNLLIMKDDDDDDDYHNHNNHNSNNKNNTNNKHERMLLLHHCYDSYNRPLWICDRLCFEIMEISYTENYTSRERLFLLGQVDKLSQYIGCCERIHQTAVPLNYARHSLRSLTLWCYSLPFALIHDFGLLTGPVMTFTSWLLYGIYQIGYSIEDPFQGSLRLGRLCNDIYNDVMYNTHHMTRSRMTALQYK